MSRPVFGRRGFALALALLSVIVLGCAGSPKPATDPVSVDGLPVGSGAFLADVCGRQIQVFTYRAADHGPDSPIVLVLAGGGRNGDDYRDAGSPPRSATAFWCSRRLSMRRNFPGRSPTTWRVWSKPTPTPRRFEKLL